MDDPAVITTDREIVLAKFDHARDDFMDLYSTVPDESLGYKPEGDEYTVGYVLPHVESVIKKYTLLLEQIRGNAWGGFEAGGLEQPPLDTEVDRAGSLSNIRALHDAFVSKLQELSPDDFARQAPVVFPDSTDPYPTGAADIAGWMTEHYYEHIPHIQGMLESWKRSK